MGRFGLSVEHFRTYWIKKGLSISERQAVALSIFMEVSLGFESIQEKYSLFTNSGYSEEDLVSNLIGFYVEVLGIHWAAPCKPVSIKASQSIWDKDGFRLGCARTGLLNLTFILARNAAASMESLLQFSLRYSVRFSPQSKENYLAMQTKGCQSLGICSLCFIAISNLAGKCL